MCPTGLCCCVQPPVASACHARPMESRRRLYPAIVALLVMLASSPVAAQPRETASVVTGVVRDVLLDPTTYAPAIISWSATRLDWQSSQVFFQNGAFEHNPNFTVSGVGDDTAVGYGTGNHQILMDAMANLQFSVVNNVSSRVVERVLLPRFPSHRRLVRTVGWIERSAMASYLTYQLSASHLRQWQENKAHAEQLGYR
jgi:hypothetical protein